MSRFYYIASNNALEELKNPYVKTYSVKEAIKNGLEIDSDFVDTSKINLREDNTVLYCEDETKLGYPSVYLVNKKDYRNIIKSKKKYFYAVDLEITDENIEVLLDYLKKQYSRDEIDLYSIYIGDDNDIKETVCSVDDLNLLKIKEFLTEDISESRLTIK